MMQNPDKPFKTALAAAIAPALDLQLLSKNY